MLTADIGGRRERMPDRILERLMQSKGVSVMGPGHDDC